MTVRLPAATRRLQLLDVATETFGENGYHATSMNDVAAAAGVTKPVLYQHFASKEALFQAVLSHVGDKLRRSLEAAVAEARSPREQVEAGFRAYFEFLRDERASAQVLFGEARRTDESISGEAERAVQSIAELVTELITVDGLDLASREVLATGIVGMAEGAGRHWIRHHDELAADRLAGLVAELAWAGLRGERHA